MDYHGKDCSLEEWINDQFGRPVTNPAWYLAYPNHTARCDVSPINEVAYITRTFEDAGRVLAPFSNAQLNQGLYYLISSDSATMLVLLDDDVPWPERKRCILSFFTLFEQIFATRCSPQLGHLGEPGRDVLNKVCYTWWDIFPFWGQVGEQPRPEIDEAFLEVMNRTLDLNSDACRESALHGLGHLPFFREKVIEIIDQFLARNPKLRPELKVYAHRAQAMDVL
jgi:hypothetical protein